MAEQRTSRPLQASEVTDWTTETDVLVVGLGAAGACAAIEAAEGGLAVLALERAGEGGGTTAASDGMIYLGGGTRLQRECGFDDTVEEMFKYIMATCGPEPNEARIRAYCEEGAPHFDWLVEHGVPFVAEFYPHRMMSPGEQGLTYSGNELVHPFRELAAPAPRAHMPKKDGQKGSFLMARLIEASERAGVERRSNMHADRLVVDDTGRVVGLQATTEGASVTFRARRAVVLTAGGFINNRKMIRRYAPELRRARIRASTEGDDGRGILMGMGAGGDAIRMDMGSVTLPFYPPKQLMKGIFVNRHGQRFMPEDVYQGRAGEIALLKQDGEVWLVLDDETFVRPETAGGEIHAAESIADLESEIGLPPGSLQATVATYNADAEKGEDTLFHKDAELLQPLVASPFGAIDLSWNKAIYAAFTLGGLATDVDGRVLDREEEPVSGLYAAGRTAASFCSPGYSSGMSIGEAMVFGRRAARHIVAQRA